MGDTYCITRLFFSDRVVKRYVVFIEYNLKSTTLLLQLFFIVYFCVSIEGVKEMGCSTVLLTSISKYETYPKLFDLTITNGEGYMTIITYDWTAQMFYELPAIVVVNNPIKCY